MVGFQVRLCSMLGPFSQMEAQVPLAALGLFISSPSSFYFRGREKERNRDLLLHSFVHSLVASGVYPGQRLNVQPWRFGTD